MRNSKVKLGIISATMDDDEPVYRAFYLDVELPHSNSIWIDPRLHISPPGTTTKHKIVEHYSIDENPKENIIRTITTRIVQLFQIKSMIYLKGK